MTKTSFIADIQTIKYNIFLDAFALNILVTRGSAWKIICNFVDAGVL